MNKKPEAAVAHAQAKMLANPNETTHAELVQAKAAELDALKAKNNASPTPSVVDTYTQRIDRTDQGNANLLIHLAGGNLRYVHETRQWLRWTGSRWQIDTHETFVTSHALEVARYYLDQCRSIRRGTHQYDAAEGTVTNSDDIYKWATKCRSKAALEAMITLARKAPGIPISVTELDKNPWLLGVENGVVDLRNGELRATESREDLVTKRCPIKYDPDARCPRWEQVLEEITGTPIPPECDANGDVIPATVGRFTPRPQITHYLHKALGYSITGEPREQLFFMAVGEGSNGKSLIFDIVKDLLGPYAKPVSSELFLATKRAPDAERPTALAASLAGVRLVISSETRKGQELDIGVIKAHTGDDDITARAMRQNPFTFKITHKPWLLTNDRAKIEHLDSAIRGRLHFLHFDRRWNRPAEPIRDPTLPDGDKTLKAYLLRDESEGILRWLVQGAMLYLTEGLKPPAEVVESTSAYFLEQDTLGRWLATLERCRPHEGMRASDLFNEFVKWCATETAAIDPHTQKAFSTALGKRGIESKGMEKGIHYGLRRAVPEPVAASTPTPAVPAPIPQRMTAKAGVWSYDQYRASGWTDEQLVAEGLMTL